MKKSILLILVSTEKFKSPKTSYILEKALVSSIVCNKWSWKKYLKKKNQLRY